MTSIVLLTNDTKWELALNSALQGVPIPYKLSVLNVDHIDECTICDLRPSFIFLVHPISGIDILQLIQQIQSACPNALYTILTETADATSAVELMKAGAYTFISKGEAYMKKLVNTIDEIHKKIIL